MSSPVPLPPPANLFEGDEAARQAYRRLLPLENQQEMLIRILGQMLIQAPSVAGRTYVADSINRCTTDQEIIQLGEFHLNHFIKYFKTNSESPSTPSTHPSRPPFEEIRQGVSDSLVAAPTSHVEAKEQALVRDNYRCMLSGVVDNRCFRSFPSLNAEVRATNASVKATQCCHILPQYISHGVDQEPRRRHASDVWTVMFLFGGIPEHELNGPGIHDLRNILTLEIGIHMSFKAWEIWLEAVEGTENQYTIERQEENFCGELPKVVTFSNASTHLPLPDPQYLALHAAYARIIKLTGAAEFIERILCDAERTKVLSEDGSSGELLNHLLSLTVS